MKKNTTILTGFLGAGKTTYLNHLIQSNPNKKYAIIENEFGEESIDSELIISTTNAIVELNNGCLCCTLNDNLYDILKELDAKKEEFDELIIEATGIADPASIAEPFLTYPAIKNSFALQNTICVVDAEQLEDRLNDTEEARKQIAFSDVLLIVKTDLVTPEQTTKLLHILQGINPLAQVVIKQENIYPFISPKEPKEITTTIKTSCNHKHSKCNHTQEDKNIITHQHTNIVTHSFIYTEWFDIATLQHQLLILLTLQSKDLYRFKAIVYTNNGNDKYIFQSVGKRLNMEKMENVAEKETRTSRFVFIGKNIQPSGFKRLLNRCKMAKSLV